MSVSLKTKAINGIFWTLGNQISKQIVSVVVSILLARVLMPADFGLIGMITIFLSFGQILVDSGLTSSLIRKTSPDELDYSTIFFTNLAISILICFLLFFASSIIAVFFEVPDLTNIIKVLSFTLVINAFGGIQNTILEKELKFRKIMIIYIPAFIIGGIIGLVMAFRGFGVWSLVFMQVGSSLVSTSSLWLKSSWKPKWLFSFQRLKEHFSFGINLTISGLIDSFFTNIFGLVIGKFFSATQLGYYSRATMLKQLPVTNISGALNKVSYPVFAAIHDDAAKLKTAYKKMMQQVIFWIAPLLIGMAVVAEPLFRFLFTEKWLPAVPYFQLLCIEGIMYPLNSYNLNVLKVKGRSDLFLKLEIFKKALAIICLYFVIQYGVYGLLYFQVVASVISYFINSYFTGRFINYGLAEQIKDILPSLLSAICMGVGCYFILNQINTFSDLLQLCITSLSGFMFYQVLSYISRSNAQADFYQIILQKLRYKVRF